ncbi:MAG: hypothetical protein RL653_3525 [Pseudomonadota bacterium]
MSAPAAGDLAEQLAVHREWVERLESCTGACEELEAHRAILERLVEAFRASLPAPVPQPPTPLHAAREMADVLRFRVQRSHRKGVGPLVTAAKQLAVERLEPLHIELMRPQARFNLAAVEVLERLVRHVPEPAGDSPGWARRRLEPLCNPLEFQLRSHRKGPGATVVRTVKQGYLALSVPLLRPALRAQAEFNAALTDALDTASRPGAPGAVLDTALEQLRARVDPVAGLGGASPVRTLRPLWRELFRRQEGFNREALSTLEQHARRARAPVAELPAFDYARHVREVERPFAEQVIRRARTLSRRPLISVVTPVHDTPAQLLEEAVASVRAQAWNGWELLLVDDGSTAPHVRPLLNRLARRDRRIRVVHLPRTSGIAAATNAGLARARGEYVAFLDHDDTLNRHALAAVACALADHPGVDVLYSDEDRPDEQGNRQRPFFKPGFSPDLLRAVNYVCHLLVVRRSLLEKLGGLSLGLDGAQDHDLVLRLSEHTSAIHHVPSVLYHWRYRPASASGSAAAFDRASRAGQRAVQAHLDRVAPGARVDRTPVGYRVRYPVQGEPLVSLVVPFKDRPELLGQLWTSLQQTRYRRFELLLVSNQSTHPDTHAFLEGLEDPRVRKLEWNHPFNYSAINNFGARHARGDLLVFLNNDVEVVDPGWLDELVSQAQRPDVGAVGPLLLFPDGAIQHAGVVLGLHGFAGHPFWRFPDQAQMTPFGHAYWARNLLAVTGACLAVRRPLFDAVGGFDERFEVCGSDVELCLRLGAGGRRVVYTPHARLLHHESASRRLDPIPDQDHWRSFVAYRPWLQAGDPFYNPNLSLAGTDCSLRVDGARGEARALEVLRGLVAEGRAPTEPRRAARQRHLVAHLEAFRAPPVPPSTRFPPRVQALGVLLSGNDAGEPELDALLSRLEALAARGVGLRWAVQGASTAAARAFRERLGAAPAAVDSAGALSRLGPVDAWLATSWDTAFTVAGAPAGTACAYWVRDDESRAYPSGSLSGLSRAALGLGLYCLVEGPGLEQALRPFLSGPAHVLLPFAAQAHPVRGAPATRPAGPFRVGVECRVSRGGPFELAVAVLGALGDAGVERVPFGEPFAPAEWGLPAELLPLSEGGPRDRARLFHGLDAAVVLTVGQALPARAAELARAGVPVVTNINPATAWAWEDGVSALACPPLPGALAAAVRRLAGSPGLGARLAAEASNRLGAVSAASELERLEQAWGTRLG